MKKFTTYLLYTGMIWAVALPVFAETVITNNVTTEANTGGGGTSSASVDIYTEINGEVVTDIHEEQTSNGGSVSIEKEVRYTSDAGSVSVEVDLSTNDSVEKKNHVVLTHADGPEEVGVVVTNDAVPVVVESDQKVSFFGRFKIFLNTYVFWWK